MNGELERYFDLVEKTKREIKRRIEGKDDVIQLIFAVIFAKGHPLLEGFPGTAKTLMVKTFAEVFSMDFNRVQMTPDLTPRELWKVTLIKSMERGEIQDIEGPVFTNLLLIDEINRAVPKTQSALLEAMEEGQVTDEGITASLPDPFALFATQNPVEQDGTYTLPEAQKDRFAAMINVDYPSFEESIRIATMPFELHPVDEVMSGDDIIAIRHLLEMEVRIDHELSEKASMLVELTRPQRSRFAKGKFLLGASPRAPKVLVRLARSLAFLKGRDFVIPEDLIELFDPVLRHRIIFARAVRPDQFDDTFSEVREEILREVFGRHANSG